MKNMSDDDNKEKPTLHLVPQNDNAGQASARTFDGRPVPTKFDDWPVDALKCHADACEGMVRELIVFGRTIESQSLSGLELLKALARLTKEGISATFPGAQRQSLQMLSQLLNDVIAAAATYTPMDWAKWERTVHDR